MLLQFAYFVSFGTWVVRLFALTMCYIWFRDASFVWFSGSLFVCLFGCFLYALCVEILGDFDFDVASYGCLLFAGVCFAWVGWRCCYLVC